MSLIGPIVLPKAGAAGSLRPAMTVALAVAAMILVADLASLLRAAAVVIGFPYEVDYGEGIVWQQMLSIAAGRGYAPIGTYPAIVYHYPPIYHLSVAALRAVTGGDPLATGRLLSLCSALATSVLVGLITRMAVRATGQERSAAISGALAGLIFLSCRPVTEWAATMRVDMLACAFSLGGLALALRGLERPRLIYPAAICFVLAVFTKQVAVAAPAAAILGLAIVRPATGLRLLAACLAIGGAGLLAAEVATGGGFLRHVILYNINRTQALRLLQLTELVRVHPIYILLAVLGAVAAWHRLPVRRNDGGRLTLIVLLTYFGLKTIMLAMVMKSGGSSNYLIEWCAPLAIFAAIGLAPAITAAHDISPPLALALVVALALQALPLGQWRDFSAEARARATELDRLSAAIRHTDGPVISDDMVLLLRAGRPVMWEPAIAAELASVGRYDERGLTGLVRRRCFAGFVTDGDRGTTTFDSRYNPPVAQAMADLYPRARLYAGLTLHLPPKGIAPTRCFGGWWRA